ncbi:MAG: hypothetical protein WBW85_19400 [Terriglobales bacterium]
MQQTFVIFARYGVFRFGEIEGDGAVLDYDCGTGIVEEVGEKPAKGIWGHVQTIIWQAWRGVSDGYTARLFGF